MSRAAALAALVLAACALGAAAQGEGARPVDLAVAAVGLAPGSAVPQWVDGVPGTGTVRVAIQNNGPSAALYRIDLAWRTAAGAAPLNGDATQSFDVAERPLPAGGRRDHDLPWRLQPGQVGVGQLEARVAVVQVDGSTESAAERAPQDNVGSRTVSVQSRSFFLDADPTPGEVEPDGSGFVRVLLRNEGNDAETVSLALRKGSTDARLRATLEATQVVVPAGTTRAVAVVAEFDPSGDFGPVHQAFEVAADPGFGIPRVVATAAIAQAAVGGSYDAEVARLGAGEVRIPAGGTSDLPFTVRNSGARSVVLTLAPSVPDGWSAQATPGQLALRPGETGQATLRVQPGQAPTGSTWEVALRATGRLVDGPREATVPVRLGGPSPAIVDARPVETPYTGVPLAVTVRVANHGDDLPGPTPMTLRVASPGLPPELVHATVPALPAQRQSDVTFLAAAPIQGGSLRMAATWQALPTALPLAFEAEALAHDVVLKVAAPTPAAGVAGETVAYRNGTQAFVVRNAGNAPEEVAFSVAAASGSAALEGDRSTVLAPGASWVVPVRHTLPMPAGAATASNLTLTARAGPAAASNTTATRILDAQGPRLVAEALPARWNVGAAHPIPLAVRVDDDGGVLAANATVTGPSGSRSVVPLARSDDGVYRGTTVLLAAGNHTVRFAARDHAGNTASTAPQRVEATTLPPPEVALDGMPGDGNLTGASLTVRVSSTLPLRAVVAQVVQPGRNETVPLVVKQGLATLDLGGFAPGPTSVTVIATDVSGATSRAAVDVRLPEAPADPGADAAAGPRDAPALGLVSAGAALAAALRRGRGRVMTTTTKPARSWDARWPVRGSIAGRLSAVAGAALLAAAILGADVLGGIPPAGVVQPPASDGADARMREARLDAQADAARLGILALPSPSISDWAAPAQVGLPPLPVPDAPAGPDPVGKALAAYARHRGVAPPDLGVATDLGLTPEGQAALARLVLAFVQASALQAEALASLTSEELALFSGDPAATAPWLRAHPEASIDDLEAHLMDVAARADSAKLAQAADLLLRTVDAVRGPLAAAIPPPTSAEALDAVSSPALAMPASWDLVRAAAQLPAATAPAPTTLAQALADLAVAQGLAAHQVPAVQGVLPPSLDAAVGSLVAAHALGARGAQPADHAAATLAAAEAALPTLQAWGALLSLPPRPAAQPDLQALAAAALQAQPSPVAIAAASGAIPAATAPAVPALEPLLQRRGLSAREAAQASASIPPQAAAPLALLLHADDTLAKAHASLAGAMGPDAWAVAAAPDAARLLDAPSWTPAEAQAMRAWALAFAAAPAERLDALARAQATAAAATAAAAALLAPWQTPMSAPPGVPVPALPAPAVQAPCTNSAISDCANNVLLHLDVAGGILVSGAGASTIDDRYGDPRVILDLGGHDTYLVSAGAASNGFGIPGNIAGPFVGSALGPDSLPGYGYVYGPWHQDLNKSLDNAQRGRFYGVLVDAAGDDRYASAAPAGQGAGVGMGTLGVLWDRAGDDTYIQEIGDIEDRLFQGAGGIGGLGLLVDERGADRYEARHGRGQGVGASPLLKAGALPSGCQAEDGGAGLSACTGESRADREDLGGAGFLFDLGDGTDAYEAGRGQGHSDGYGAIGLLYDEAGASHYQTTPTSLHNQGGRGTTAVPGRTLGFDADPPKRGGFAALIDLGGAGDTYVAPAFPGSGLQPFLDGGWMVTPAGAPRKADDVLWAETRGGLALGIDSTLLDEDGDGHANFAELLAGSDPEDPQEVPEEALLGTAAGLAQQVQQLVASTVNSTRDRDGDRFPDGVEAAAGSDPDDPASTPGLLNDPGFLLTAAVLCPVGDEDAAPCAAPCQGPTCVSLVSVGAPGATHHARPALIEIDLGGDDTYNSTVAGPGAFLSPNGPRAFGSVSLDVEGNDAYEAPDLDLTQAAATSGASLLLDLAGNDRYRARDDAQAAARSAVAILADFAGDDRYQARRRAQGDADGPASASAALIDLAGNDDYQADTQARVRGTASIAFRAVAVLLDAQGSDRYTVTAPGATPFDRQGVSAVNVPAGTDDTSRATTTVRALFADLGEDTDAYLDASIQPPRDDSGTKNGRVLHTNPSATGAGVFTDGLLGDKDGDGFPSAVEALAGSDPLDAASVPASPEGVALRPAGLAGIRLPGLVIAGPGDDTHLERADLLVDLGGNDRYLGRQTGGVTPALHGPDGAPLATTLVLDAGGDDEYRPDPCVTDLTLRVDRLRTQDSNEVSTAQLIAFNSQSGALASEGLVDPRVLLHCPALGGAVVGVAVVADQGGTNTFDAATRLRLAADARTPSGSPGNADVQVRAWGVSLGASLFAGAGVLATFDGSSVRTASLDVTAEESGTLSQDPAADAFGVSHGAVYGRGAGASLAFGGGDDAYVSEVTASAPRPAGQEGGRSRAYAQAAAVIGVATLLDDGGANRFHAPAGFAQGFAAPPGRPLTPATPQTAPQHDPRPAALLWTGAGNDAFLGGIASQAAAGTDQYVVAPIGINPMVEQAQRRPPAVATLVNTGGDDTYALAAAPGPGHLRVPACPWPAPTQSCALSQGAAELGGVAALFDWAGDDSYLAAGRTHVQGAGRLGGHGLLADASGNDRYEAGSDGQAFAATDQLSSPAASGTLIDLAGRDSYAIGQRGQGYSSSPAAKAPLSTLLPLPPLPFDETALFLDLGGRDRYEYGMDKAPVSSQPRPASGNDWQWTQQPPPQPAGLARGVGIDGNGLDEAVAQYNANGAGLPAVGTASLCVRPPGGACLAPGTRVQGAVEAVASVTAGPGMAAQRVAILRDGVLMGHATPAGTTGPFVLPWDTRLAAEGGVADGTYTLAAVAWMTPIPAGGPAQASPPDGLPVSSADVQVAVDNAPAGRAGLSRDALSPRVPATAATLAIDVGSDVQAPAGQSGVPGANVRVELAGPQSAVLHDAYAANGTLVLPVTGQCGGAPCADGHYTLTVTLRDAGGQATQLPPMALLVDGTPPASTLLVPPVANATLRVGADGLVVGWQATDALSGVAKVAALRLAPDGLVLDAQVREAPIESATFTGIASGTTHRFVTIATDALGNEESPCGATQTYPACPAAKLADAPELAATVAVDFLAPSVLDLRAEPPIVRPGVPVRLSALVTDSEDGLAGAFLSASGARTITRRPMSPDADGRHAVAVTFSPSVDPDGEETPYVFTVQAADDAGNEHPGERAVAILDSRAPRLGLLQATYRDGPDDVPVGRPGALARLVILADDHRTEHVAIDGTPLGLSPLDCGDEAAGRRWLCAVPLPDGTPDGRHTLTVTAVDAAGNLRELAVEVVVDSLPPPILSPRVTAIAPDAIEVAWETTAPTLGALQYGRTPALGRQTAFGEERATQHTVRLEGLSPASLYYLRPIAVSEANNLNDTAPLLQATTASAFGVAFPAFPTTPDWAGTREVPVDVTLLLGSDPVSLLLKVQDAARSASPLPVDSLVAGAGRHELDVETLLLPDGDYRAILEGTRQGDTLRVESPTFRVDNTAPVVVPVVPGPGKVSAARRPVLEAEVVDPLRTDVPPAASAALILDGVRVEASASYAPAGTGGPRLRLALPDDLADGAHEAWLRVTDSAGNVGDARWSFTVDSAAPDAVARSVRYAQGAPAGRPGGPASAWLELRDASGPAAAHLDLRAWGAGNASLAAHANGTWSIAFTIPDKVPGGRVEVPVHATDRHGNAARAGVLALDIDASAPTLESPGARALNRTAILVTARTAEDAVLEVQGVGRSVRGGLGRQHAITVAGLVPGTEHTFTLLATDLAGNVANASVRVRLPDDGEPPQAPATVQATPGEDGMLVTWEPAQDNAGVARYIVTRVQFGNLTAIDAGRALSLVDPGAWPGPVTYRVHAIDVAGLAGPAAEAHSKVLTPVDLASDGVTPRQGPAGKPFEVQVRYRHPGGLEPEAVVLHHAGVAYPMQRLDATDCRLGCVYWAEVLLPPRDALRPTGATYIEATVAGVPTRLALDAPLVLASEDGFRASPPRDAAGALLPLALAALAAALLARRGGRR